MHRILLLGAQGQLGRQLQKDLQVFGDVRSLTRTEVDLSQPSLLSAWLGELARSWQPTLVVNAAAYTSVDQAESEPEKAHAVNALAPALLAEFAQEWGAILVHYSTDYVFDGTGDVPWQETDLPRPLSAYGRSKLAGEQAVRQVCAKHLILRTSWVFGAQGSNFLNTILRLAAERESLRIVADQIGAPTSVSFLARATVQALEIMQFADIADTRWGLYHVATTGEVSWHGYAQYVLTQAQMIGLNLKCSPQQVYPITSGEYPLAAPRPLNSRLNSTKIENTFGIKLPKWQEEVIFALNHRV